MATSRRTRQSSSRSMPRAAARATPDTDPDQQALPEADAPGAASEPLLVAPEGEEEGGASGSSPAVSSSQRLGTSTSSRRTVGRSSRRRSASSSASVSALSTRMRLTPVEQAERRRALMAAMRMVLLVVVLTGAAIAAWWIFLRTTPAELTAEHHLSDASTALALAQEEMTNDHPDQAKSAVNQGLKALSIPELGNATPPFDAHAVANLQLAQRAADLRQSLLALEPGITKREEALAVDRHAAALRQRYGSLMALSDGELDALEKDTNAFLDNPIDPAAGKRDDAQETYADIIAQLRSDLPRIAEEKARRLASVTSDQVTKAHGEVEFLVKQELFQQALDKLDGYKTHFADDAFDTIRSYVTDAAKSDWDGVQSFVQSRMIDYHSPGIPAAIAAQALTDARSRLNQVIDRFGIPDYVDKAKAMLASLPAGGN